MFCALTAVQFVSECTLNLLHTGKARFRISMHNLVSHCRLNRAVLVDIKNTLYSLGARAAAPRDNSALVHSLAIELGAGVLNMCAEREVDKGWNR